MPFGALLARKAQGFQVLGLLFGLQKSVFDI
jgi:hypothetical protein